MKGPLKLTQILAILAMLECYSQAHTIQNAISSVGKAITQEIVDIKKPIVGKVTQIASSQCSSLKKLIGVDYAQLDGHKEPDLNNLTLTFICPEATLSFNLSTVARLLPLAKGYNLTDKLVVYMHGFTDNPEKTNFEMINEAFRKKGHTNILALDASQLIAFFYLRSTTYVQFIGEKMGETLAAMYHNGLPPKNMHLVGHSLGCYIAAFTGKQFKKITGLAVDRVTCLDPAGPCFNDVDADLRLKKTDAEFVDVIHTDAGVFGITDSVGHIDYFPNGGSQQPDCLLDTCNHSRAVALFAESIEQPDAFPARRCKDWDSFKEGRCYNETSLMGLNSAPGVDGQYFLQTNGTTPYGLGKEGITYENKDGIFKTIANIFG